jgi:hypothetical protein
LARDGHLVLFSFDNSTGVCPPWLIHWNGSHTFLRSTGRRHHEAVGCWPTTPSVDFEVSEPSRSRFRKIREAGPHRLPDAEVVRWLRDVPRFGRRTSGTGNNVAIARDREVLRHATSSNSRGPVSATGSHLSPAAQPAPPESPLEVLRSHSEACDGALAPAPTKPHPRNASREDQLRVCART